MYVCLLLFPVLPKSTERGNPSLHSRKEAGKIGAKSACLGLALLLISLGRTERKSSVTICYNEDIKLIVLQCENKL